MKKILRSPKSKLRMNSIKWKILLPMSIVMITQAVLFSGVIVFGGTVQKLNSNAFDLLNSRVVNRKDYLENEMVMRWSAIDNAVVLVEDKIEAILQETGRSPDALQNDRSFSAQVLEQLAPDMIGTLRQKMTNGIFVVLGDTQADGEMLAKKSRPCLFLRDQDPTTAPENNSDLLLSYAPVSVFRKLSIPLDTFWQAQLDFDPEKLQVGDYDFYCKPVAAAIQHPNALAQDLAYWSGPFRLDARGEDMITYSQPLRGSDGEVYGVLGTAISADYIESLLPYSELGEEKTGSYWLGKQEKEKVFDRVVSNGPLAERYFSEHPLSLQGNGEYANILQARTEEPMYAAVQYLNLYNSNTPFANERWALIGLMQGKDLLGFTHGVQNAVALAFVLSLAGGLGGILLAGNILSRPVVALVRRMHDSDPSRPIVLGKTGIFEIDELTTEAETLSRKVADSASKLSRLIELANMPIGAFEYQSDPPEIVLSGHFLDLMQLSEPQGDTPQERLKSFEQMMQALAPSIEENRTALNEYVCSRTTSNGEPRWVRMKIVTDGPRVMGVVSDITQEIIERRKIEWERDYDQLTGLYNRRAFNTKMNRLFERPERLKLSAMVMLDLDNLKFINDTYGHDFGDVYLRGTANLLSRNSPKETVISRMSGDEFYVFFHGCETEEQLTAQINALREGVRGGTVQLPNGSPFKVRASAGIARYPRDSSAFEELLKFADFAMYKIKNTIKGEFNEFNRESYEKEVYLLRNKEDLNQLIEEQLVDYFFQPIVDVETGKPFAYEALMRPSLAGLRTPFEVMNLARNQSKLYQIERLTWFKALEKASRIRELLEPDSRIFINSVANQALSESDMTELEQRFGPLLSRVVIEVTEGERLDGYSTEQKKMRAAQWGCGFALDDFGTGYNSDVALLTLTPDFVKIDMSIVRNVDRDPDRQTILRNLISYSKDRAIRVIAEGVETAAEMQVLIGFGVDYIQGYYVGKPASIPEKIPPEIQAKLVDAFMQSHRLEE